MHVLWNFTNISARWHICQGPINAIVAVTSFFKTKLIILLSFLTPSPSPSVRILGALVVEPEIAFANLEITDFSLRMTLILQ